MNEFSASNARALRFAPLASILAVLAAGCGDDGGGPAPMDGGPMDDDAPELVSTNPLQNERGVSPETVFLFQFDEPMNTEAGTVTINPGGEVLAATGGSWFESDTRLSLRPAAALGQGVDYELVIEGFQDVAGNEAEATTLGFETLDEEAPTIVSSTPAQDESGLSARLEEIRVVFSEPMDQDDGDVDLQGGPRSIGPAEWLDDRTVRWPVDGLAYERDYELFLFGFRDRFGNDFDDTVYVDEGILRFQTGVDDESPFVSSTAPMEGAMGVNPSRTTASFSFVEPMDTSVRGAVLFIDDDTEGTPLDGRWSGDGTRLTFEFQPLGQERDFRIDLTGQGHADAVGNPLDLTTYLGDGALDFSSGLDTFAPTVVASSIEDGATGVAIGALDEISITFSEAMDTGLTVVIAVDTQSGDATDLPITWAEVDRVALIDGSRLSGGVPYAIDVTVLTDVAGNAVSADAFTDGRLDFEAVPPTGESCRDALGVAQATLMDGVYTWDLAGGSAADADGGGETCDSTPGRDLVIAYEKTTNSLSEGGQLLSVVLDSTSGANIEIAEGVCDPNDSAFESLSCTFNQTDTEFAFDVGPGTYFIYVSDDLSTGTFPAMTVSVTEVDTFPEGESCNRPFDTDSATYTAPASTDDPHVWNLPESVVSNYDRTSDNSSDPSSCGDTSTVGPDAVIVFDKTSASSVLQVTVENMATSTADDLVVNVSTTCDASVTADVVGCIPDVDGGADTLAVSAPSGPVYIWLLRDDTDFFPETRVSVREVTVSEGEACSFPRSITSTGMTSVTLDSGERFGAPSCFPETGNVTWFSYTAPSSGYVRIAPNAGGAIALVDGGRQLVCGNDDFPVTPAFLAAGQEVCIAIANDATISQLDVAELSYDGIEGTITDPGYLRALSESGSEISWSSADAMTASPTTLYVVASTSTLVALPKAGGDRAVEIAEIGSTEIGDVLIARNEQLFSIDDTTSSTSNRVYRLWDGFTAPWDPVVWDTTFSYPTDDMASMTFDGTDFIYAGNDLAEADFFRLGASRSGTASQIGVTNDVIEYVVGIAADSTWIYYLGEAAIDPADTEGLFRIRRSDLSDGSNEPEPILVKENLGASTSLLSTFAAHSIYLDDPEDPSYLYFRTVSPNQVHVVADPAGTPVYLGVIVELGDTADYPMTYDYYSGSLYLFETETTSDGRIVKID